MKTIFSVFIFLSLTTFSQQGRIWTFGVGARLDFVNNQNPPNVSSSSISSYEASSTITDVNGNLLFYTDGVRIYDNNDNIVQTGLLGSSSAAQGGIIIPEPGTTPGAITNRYYVISLPQLGSERARFTIVDMNSGVPTILPIDLNNTLPDHLTAQNTTEALSVARHCNGKDYWLITHELGNNKFKTYQITNSGILPPVISTVGPIVPTGSNNTNAACCMKISPNSKKLAFCVRQTSVNLFDFNQTTGVISNLSTLVTGTSRDYYGVEFSPNGNVLYYSDLYTNIYKYDLINSVNQTLGAPTNLSLGNLYGALQRASNGKIYLARDGNTNMTLVNQPALGVITNPNNFAGVTFNPNGQSLFAGTGSKVGLPNFVPTLISRNISNDTTICEGNSVALIATGGVSYSWSPDIGLNTTTGPNVTATPISTQTYVATIVDFEGCINPEIVTITIDTDCCNQDTLFSTNDVTYCLNDLITYPDGTIETAINNTIQISNLFSQFGCDSIVTTNVTVMNNFQSDQNFTICYGSNFTFPDGVEHTAITSNESYNSIFTTSNGCDSIITTNLEVFPNNSIFETITICNGSDYTFPDGSNEINITSDLTHLSVFVNSFGCDSTITTNLNIIESPYLSLDSITTICNDEPFNLFPDSNADHFIWNTSDTTFSISITEEGIYSVIASNMCGSETDSTQVISEDCFCVIYVPNTFTPNNNEYNQTFGIEYDCNFYFFKLQIFNRWGEIIFESLDADYRWDGTFNGRIVPDGMYTYLITYSAKNILAKQISGHVNVLR